MSTSTEFTDYILELLEPIPEVTYSKMFGGVLFKVGDRQLGVVLDDTLFFKVTDEELQERYQSEGSKQFTYKRKDKKHPVVIKNWWSVPEEALDNGDRLVELAEEVLSQKKER